jgi:photosystem II stability/assembly factor-like uncharacterized protein
MIQRLIILALSGLAGFSILAITLAEDAGTSLADPQLLGGWTPIRLTGEPRAADVGAENRVYLATRVAWFSKPWDLGLRMILWEGRLGGAWTPLHVLETVGLYELAVNHTTPMVGYVSTYDGLYRFDRQAVTLLQPPESNARQVAPAWSDATTVYSAFNGGLQRSSDAGRTWQLVRPMNTTPDAGGVQAIYDIGVSSADPNVLYVADSDAVHTTSTGGFPWRAPWRFPEGRPIVLGFAPVPTYGDHMMMWFDTSSGEAGAPAQFYRSLDKGATWENTGQIQGDPLDVAALRGSEIPHPFELHQLFIAHTDDREAPSDAELRLQHNRLEGLENSWLRLAIMPGEAGTAHVAVDPSRPDRVAMTGGMVMGYRTRTNEAFRKYLLGLPPTWGLDVNPTSDQSLVELDQAGIRRTTDGGATWEDVSDWQLIEGYQGDLHYSPADPTYLYGVATVDSRAALIRSYDGGQTWSVLRDWDIPMLAPNALAGVRGLVADPRDKERVYITFGDRLEFRQFAGNVESWTETLRTRTSALVALAQRGGANVENAQDMLALSATTEFDPASGDPLLPDAAYTFHRSDTSGLRWTTLTTTIRGVYPTRDRIVLAIHPAHPGVYFVSTPNQLYRSTDGGQSWQLVLDLPWPSEDFPNAAWTRSLIRGLALHESQPGLVYVGTSLGVLESTDLGGTWRPLGLASSVAPVLSVSEDGAWLVAAGEGVWKRPFGRTGRPDPTPSPGPTPTQLAPVSPLDTFKNWQPIVPFGRPIDVAFGADGAGYVLTTDSWAPPGGGDPASNDISLLWRSPTGVDWQAVAAFDGVARDLAISPSLPQAGLVAASRGVTRLGGRTYWPAAAESAEHVTLAEAGLAFAVFGGQIQRSADGGSTWQPVQRIQQVSALAVAPSDSQVVYAADVQASETVLLVSQSGGRAATWAVYNHPVRIVALAVNPLDASHAYAAVEGGTSPLYETTNFGRTLRALTVQGLQGRLSALVVDGAADNRMYGLHGVSQPDSVSVSLDAGRTWRPLAQASSGRSLVGLALGPKGSGALLSAESGPTQRPGFGSPPVLTRLLRTIDSGDRWSAPRLHLDLRSLAVNPTTDGTGLGVLSSNGEVLRTSGQAAGWSREVQVGQGVAALEGLNVAYHAAGLKLYARLAEASDSARRRSYTSVNVGRDASGAFATWPLSPIGEASGRQSHLVVDPSNEQRLFASAGDDVMRSTDGGVTWQSVYRPPARIVSLAMHPTFTSYLVAGFNDGSRTRFARSRNGGGTWEELPGELPGRSEDAALAIHPCTYIMFSSNINSFWRSVDAGQTWHQVLVVPEPGGSEPRSFGNWARQVTVHPQAPTVVYAAGFGGVWMSTDTGTTWDWCVSGSAIDLDFSTAQAPHWLFASDPVTIWRRNVRADGLIRPTPGPTATPVPGEGQPRGCPVVVVPPTTPPSLTTTPGDTATPTVTPTVSSSPTLEPTASGTPAPATTVFLPHTVRGG